MLFSLVKKDFILVKKDLLILLIFAVIAPIFVTIKIPFSSGGFLGFFITVTFLEYLLFNTVSIAENKYKGSALLCTTTYSRNELVKAKYLFILVIFICNYFIYTITAFVIPIGIDKLNVFTLGISLLIITIYFGISIPVLYKFGYEKTKYISMTIIFITPFIFPIIAKWLYSKNINLQNIIPFPKAIQNLFIYFLVLVIGLISMTLSMHLYSKKDL